MPQVFRSNVFDRWLTKLRDGRARARIEVRILRLQRGNAGDAKSVGGGISEIRIDYGPGYRVYFMQKGSKMIVLLCGGDKSTQRDDIRAAAEIARGWEK